VQGRGGTRWVKRKKEGKEGRERGEGRKKGNFTVHLINNTEERRRKEAGRGYSPYES